MEIGNALKSGGIGGKGWAALVLFCAVTILLPLFSAHADELFDRTYNACTRQCVEPCCQEKCGYAACITSTAAGQMGIAELTDPRAWDAAMDACQSRIGEIRRCGNEQVSEGGGGDFRECELLISGALDDHYRSGGRYRMRVSINGEVKFRDSATRVFSHGRPYGSVFSNWRILSLKVPRHLMREGSLHVEFQHEGSSPKDWIAVDYMELVCGRRSLRTEIGGVDNYGVEDRSAGVIYGGQSNGWTIDLPGGPRSEPPRRELRIPLP